jgi:hypothetical protein
VRNTKEKVEKKAKEILKTIDFAFDDGPFSVEEVDIKEEVNYTLPVWRIGFDFGEAEFGKSRTAFLDIDDASLKPLILQTGMNTFLYFKIDEKGKIQKSTKPFPEE